MDLTNEPVVELLAQLVALETANPPGREAPAARLVADYLRTAGLEPRVIDVAPDRANVLVRLGGQRSRPAMLWLGHLDTVPAGGGWASPPFEPVIQDGRLTGRGASDMKSGVAAMVAAAATLAHARLPQDLYLYLTCDEEADGLGAQRLLAEPFLGEVGAVIVGEPTGLQLGVCEKGALWLELTTHGRTAHGSAPELGVNAIEQMAQVVLALSRLEVGQGSHPLLGRDTLSAGTIHGGLKVNIVPDQCRLTLDYRFLPGQDPERFRQEVHALLGQLQRDQPNFSATTKVLTLRPAFATPLDSAIVSATLTAAREALGTTPAFTGLTYFTDAAPLVTATGLPAVIFGPGEISQMHAANESVSLDNVRRAIAVYRQLALKALPGE